MCRDLESGSQGRVGTPGNPPFSPPPPGAGLENAFLQVIHLTTVNGIIIPGEWDSGTGVQGAARHQLKEEPFYGCHEPSPNTSHRAKDFPGHWTLQAGTENRSCLEPLGAPISVALQRGRRPRAPSTGSRRTAGRPRVVHHAFDSECFHPGHQRLHHAPRAGEGQGGVDSAFSSSLIRSRSR